MMKAIARERRRGVGLIVFRVCGLDMMLGGDV